MLSSSWSYPEEPFVRLGESVGEWVRLRSGGVRCSRAPLAHALANSTRLAPFSKSRTLNRRAGIWLAGNLRVEVVARCLYVSSCREIPVPEARSPRKGYAEN